MENEERAALIRKGNEFFNAKDYANSLKIFLATDYKDGIARVADYYLYDKKDAVSAMKLYKRAGHQNTVEDFAVKVVEIVRILLAEDKHREKQKKEAESAVIKQWKPVVISVGDLSGPPRERSETNDSSGRKSGSEGGKGKN